MIPDGYRAPRRQYQNIRQDVVDGNIGLKSGYMADDATGRDQRYHLENYERYTDTIDEAENAGEILNGVITVDWRDNHEGPQAKASLIYFYVDSNGRQRSAEYEGRRTGGGGYDKASTAISDVLNMSPEFRRLLMYARENGKDFGYGAHGKAGESYPPEFSWGVGVGSLISTLRGLGIDMHEIEGRRNTTVYALSRIDPLPSESVRSTMSSAYNRGRGAVRNAKAKTKQTVSKAKPKKAPAKTSSSSCRSKTAPKSKSTKPKTMGARR